MALTLINVVKKRLRERNLLHVVDLLESEDEAIILLCISMLYREGSK